jgi:hypothetical protein
VKVALNRSVLAMSEDFENVDFPFAKARRITPEEVAAAKQAVKEQFGIEPGKVDRMVDRTPQHPLRSIPIDIPADFDEPMTDRTD